MGQLVPVAGAIDGSPQRLEAALHQGAEAIERVGNPTEDLVLAGPRFFHQHFQRAAQRKLLSGHRRTSPGQVGVHRFPPKQTLLARDFGYLRQLMNPQRRVGPGL